MKVDKILILGLSGMLGHKLFLQLSRHKNYEVYATARNRDKWIEDLPPDLSARVRFNVEAGDMEGITRIIAETGPDLVINCIGIVKQQALGKDHLASISINALFPHLLARACGQEGTRLLHISTDCVFSGNKGGYTEDDTPDCVDLYGRSKLLGEVDYPHCLTLRTSIIGPELGSQNGLIAWFLAQENKIQGYTRHIYSGFTTVELARIIARYIISNPSLSGVYHLSSDPISKYDLLCLVAKRYGKEIEIEPYDGTVCDRSLDSAKLRRLLDYTPPSWPDMIDRMYRDHSSSPYFAQDGSVTANIE